MERQPEQAAFAVLRADGARAMLRNGSPSNCAVVHDPDLAALLDDEDAAAAVARVGDRQRRDKPVDHPLEVQRDALGVEGSASGRRRRGGRAG